MNALGQCVGRSIFPKQDFNKNEVFAEIKATIVQIENLIGCANDLLPFYGSSTSCVTRRVRSVTSASPSIHTLLPSANHAANTRLLRRSLISTIRSLRGHYISFDIPL
ncbi:hypothetical protein VN97_g8214 [Penicillium thymicola]|uniref:Uncharacterized protein n=1 Tax=Penicillium thymicola TaxID=293382 RepID=A0AAI9TDT2_PENTH|nr:hypothetical protein VN97_g8214 [Penicillium thymicola]